MPLLEVRDLKVHFEIQDGWVKAVDGVSFSIDSGETMGLVGESGCGKTTAAYAITQLLPPNGFIKGGQIFFKEPERVRSLRIEYDRRYAKSPKARKREIAAVQAKIQKLKQKLDEMAKPKGEMIDRMLQLNEEIDDCEYRSTALAVAAATAQPDELSKSTKALKKDKRRIAVAKRKARAMKKKLEVLKDTDEDHRDAEELAELSSEAAAHDETIASVSAAVYAQEYGRKPEKTMKAESAALELKVKELNEKRKALEERRGRILESMAPFRKEYKEYDYRLSALKYSYDLLGKSIRKDGSLDDYNEEIRKIRWKEISMIFQGAMNAFNPVFRVGDQIVEAITLHKPVSEEEARRRARELFEFVGISPDRIDNYPHEFSGGMKQRAMIALALSLNPSFVIADEPTTALDVITQDRILAEIQRLQKQLRMAMMIITHDVSVVAEVSNKIGVMYAGLIMETGQTAQVFKNTAHPYTAGLLGSFPSIRGEKKRLDSIPGFPPDLVNPPDGCPFHPRCPYAEDRCREERPKGVLIEEPDHFSYCHYAEKLWDKLRRDT